MKHRHAVTDHRAPAQAPDSLVHVGQRRMDQPTIQVYDYGAESFAEFSPGTPAECRSLEKEDSPTWIRVTGLHEPEMVRQLLEHYGIHPLVHQDVLNTNHQPKLDEYPDYLFLTARLVTLGAESAPDEQHFSLVLTARVVITFQEAPSPIFDPVVARLRDGKGRFRTQGPDYLTWALLDAIVDNYLLVLNQLEDRVATLEEALMDENKPNPNMQDFYNLRMCSLQHYRSLRPMREVVSQLLRLDSGLIAEGLNPFFRDLHDHTWHAIENADHLRESITALREFYQSTLAQKMNEVMKVLAAISTLFLPLTFIAGVYGMNFRNQPELNWKYGYQAVWSLFIGLGVLMWWYFKRKKWL
jgi:magnesium transporter